MSHHPLHLTMTVIMIMVMMIMMINDDNDDNDTHLELLGVVVVVSQVPFSNTNCELTGQETVTNVI